MKRLRYLLMREVALLFILVVWNVCHKKGSSAARTHQNLLCVLRLLREDGTQSFLFCIFLELFKTDLWFFYNLAVFRHSEE